MAAENGLQQVKVDRTHLRSKNVVAPAPHPVGELCPVIGHLLRMRDDVFFLSHVHGGEQTADPDPRRAKVVDLVDLQDGVQLPAVFKNLADLVCGDGVQPTAKRVELNQFKILMAGDEFGSSIETGMIHPLIRDAHRTFGIKVDRETVLGEHREPEACDHFRNAVVDLGINVIGTACENNAAAMRGLHLFQHAGALLTDVLFGAELLRPGAVCSFPDIGFRNLPVLGKERDETVGGSLLIGHGDERPEITDILIRHVLHVVFEILRIGNDNGTVEMVLGITGFLMLIEYAGMEDGTDTAVDEPLDMSVGQLCGITLGFRGNGVHTALIKLPG